MLQFNPNSQNCISTSSTSSALPTKETGPVPMFHHPVLLEFQRQPPDTSKPSLAAVWL